MHELRDKKRLALQGWVSWPVVVLVVPRFVDHGSAERWMEDNGRKGESVPHSEGQRWMQKFNKHFGVVHLQARTAMSSMWGPSIAEWVLALSRTGDLRMRELTRPGTA